MTNPTADARWASAVLERLDASIERNVALDVASMSPEMQDRYRDALRANAQVRAIKVLEEIRQRWLDGYGFKEDNDEDIELRDASDAALSEEKAPEPVSTEMHADTSTAGRPSWEKAMAEAIHEALQLDYAPPDQPLDKR